MVDFMIIALVVMVIPAAILVGLVLRGPQSSLVAMSGAAILALAAFWFLLDGASGLKGGLAPYSPLNIYVFAGATLLLLASWTLGLAGSVESRRWAWTALLIVAGYLSIFAVVSTVASPDPCLFPPSIYTYASSYCPTANVLAGILVAAGTFLAPAVALASALPFFSRRGLLPGRHIPLDGLNVSPRATTTPEGDTDPELHAERP